jgi:hypothetical protein
MPLGPQLLCGSARLSLFPPSATAGSYFANVLGDETGRLAIGHDMQRGPPRPEPSSDPAIATTSIPAASNRALGSTLRS